MKKMVQVLLPFGVAVFGMLWMGSGSASAAELAVATDTTAIVADVGTPDTWVHTTDGSWSYYGDDGSKCVGMQAIDGQIYVFAQDGTLRTGWQTVDGCRRYYDPETGQALDGWIHYQGRYYYVAPNGGKCTGIQLGLPTLSGEETDADTQFFLDDCGALQLGWFTDADGFRYYADKTSGAIVTGEVQIDGVWYSFQVDGRQSTGWVEIQGNSYYFDQDTGESKLGLVRISDGYYYITADGGKQTGMQTINGRSYYFDPSTGVMRTGWITTAEGARYYAKSFGAIVTGEVQLDGVWYSFQADGRQSTGWVKIQGHSYYFDQNTGESKLGLVRLSDGTYYITAAGGKQTGAQTIDGKSYYFNTSTGAMHTGWLTTAAGVYYYNSTTGVQQPAGLCTISGSQFYFQANGTLLRSGTVTVNGKTYVADANGVLTEKKVMPEKDASGNTYVMGESRATVAQMQSYIRSVNPNVAQSVLDMIPYYISEGEAEGVRGDIAFAQACLETGNFTFKGSAVTLSQNNFCGLGVTQNGMKGCSFSTPQLGIRAQIQHLKAYASTESLHQAQIDPRFGYVTRGSAPVVEWLGIQENPKHLGWAAGKNYGSKILNILAAILKR